MTEPISILGIDTARVGHPRNDGTPGSGLYTVPIRLSRAPSGREVELLLYFWDNPSSFTTMHRPGIARVSGSSFVLDGTTIEEVRDTHATTIKLAVNATNSQFALEAEAGASRRAAQAEHRATHEEDVKMVADEINFD